MLRKCVTFTAQGENVLPVLGCHASWCCAPVQMGWMDSAPAALVGSKAQQGRREVGKEGRREGRERLPPPDSQPLCWAVHPHIGMLKSLSVK